MEKLLDVFNKYFPLDYKKQINHGISPNINRYTLGMLKAKNKNYVVFNGKLCIEFSEFKFLFTEANKKITSIDYNKQKTIVNTNLGGLVMNQVIMSFYPTCKHLTR